MGLRSGLGFALAPALTLSSALRARLAKEKKGASSSISTWGDNQGTESLGLGLGLGLRLGLGL